MHSFSHPKRRCFIPHIRRMHSARRWLVWWYWWHFQDNRKRGYLFLILHVGKDSDPHTFYLFMHGINPFIKEKHKTFMTKRTRSLSGSSLFVYYYTKLILSIVFFFFGQPVNCFHSQRNWWDPFSFLWKKKCFIYLSSYKLHFVD